MIYVIGSRGIPARYGGFETLAQRLNDGFNDRGIPVTVVGTRDTSIRSSIPGRLVARRPFKPLETPLLTWTSRPHVGPDDDVLVLNPINVWTAKHLARTGARVWLHMDGMEHERRKWGRLARCAHRIARRTAARSNLGLIVDSQAIGRLLHHEFGTATTYIGYGGCTTAESDPQHRWNPAAPGDNYLVVARPEPENNLLEICRAFNAAGITSTLTIVGAPDRPTPYWRLVEAEAGRNPKIRLSPAIWDRKSLCHLYISCRAVVHGHSAGGTNPALVDALSHSVPVLAHDNPFNRETIGETGRFWANEDALTTFFVEDAQDPPKPHAWSGNSLLNWTHVIEAYRHVLHRT